MRRLVFIIALIAVFGVSSQAQAVRVNIDHKTVAAMTAAYGAEAFSEQYYNEQLGEILDRYSAAEVAAAAIFATKYLDRKALTNIGIWGDGTENYYYRRIYNLVAVKIMPKMLVVARQMLHSPQTALYWGSYLMKICEETKSLCYQFESVVTNSSLSFSDIAFLSINPEVAQLFDVTKLGNVNWERMLDDFADVSSHFTKENLENDLDKLYSIASELVTQAGENASESVYNESEFNAAISGNADAVIDLITRYEAIYDSLSQSVSGTLMSYVGAPENVHRLFDISNYELTSWISDYLNNDPNSYYIQRFYIYCEVEGAEQELLKNYAPSYYECYKVSHTGVPTSEEWNAIRQNSEQCAGWDETRVKYLNMSSERKYHIDYYDVKRFSYYGSQNGELYSYGYCIKVTRDKTSRQEVYEDLFDSYSMDFNSFTTQMNIKLAAYNENKEGVKYHLGRDDKQYYTAADEARMKGCESVIISATCHDSAELGGGSTQFKCRECNGTLNAHSKQCAMKTTVTESGLDTSELDSQEQSAQQKIGQLNARITLMEQQNNELVKQISESDIATAAQLRQQYNANKDEIGRLKQELAQWQQNLADIQAAKEEMGNDNEVATDDHYRIPAIMAEAKADYRLTWTDNGSWNGYTFTRHATAANLKGTITFTATLSIARKPKKFLGILIHRCITQISWKLAGSYSESQIVDIIELDPEAKDSDKATLVNQRISQAAQDYPGCDITTEYIQNDPMEADSGDDTYHLLWASDRLDIARQVEARLAHIYADLVSLEKMMNYKLGIVDVLKKIAPYVNADMGRRHTLIQERYNRWRQSMKAAR